MRRLLHDIHEQTRGRPALTALVLIYALLPFVLCGVAVYSVIQRSQINHVAQRIQASRIEATRRACVEQNDRHDKTIMELDALIQLAPADKRAESERNRAYTVRLIDALVPYRDCDQVVDRIRLG